MSIFTLHKTAADSAARRGTLRLPHARVETPVFMPVGTQGTVKAMTFEEVAELGYPLILGNTFHLFLRPGSRHVAQAGGLHRFIGWEGAILTDSGGYQVFSLKELRKITRNGVLFRSPVDGAYHEFTPESVVHAQHELGADIIMAFDECPPYPSTWEYAKNSLERTHRWAEQCILAHGDATGQSLFGIVQGGTFEDLRVESARVIGSLPFPGIAVGGVSVGEPPEEMRRVLAATLPLLPPDRPRYLMGVGTPEDILDAVVAGVDMFDCVLPTRLGRNGALYTARGRVNIANARWKDEWGPVDPDCPCRVCRRHSAAYLRHLHQSNEILGCRLGTYHNLAFYARLLQDIRTAIETDSLLAFRAACREQWQREIVTAPEPSR